MGFLKKIGKGLRKAFKKIGKGIKKAFAKFGKFMGKIGILGQLAMMFILPGIGGALLKGFGSMAGNMASLTGKFAGLSGSALGGVVKGVGTVLKGAHSFVQTGVNAFKTVTKGITEFGKSALDKIPGINISSAKPMLGEGGVFESIKLDSKRIFDPFKSNLTVGKGMNLKSMSQTTGLSESTIQKLNPQMDFANLKQGTNINLDFNQVSIDKAAISGQVNNISNQAVLDAGASAPKVSDYDLSISPDQTKSLNYDVGSLDSAGQQFNYTTTGQEFPMGSQYPVDTITSQTGTFNPQLGLETTTDMGKLLQPVGGIKTPSLLDGVSNMQKQTLGFETELGFPKPIEGQFNIDLTQPTTDSGFGIKTDSAFSSDSLLTPKEPSSMFGNMGQRVKDTFVGLPGKIGESVVNTGVNALSQRLIHGAPEEYDSGPTGTGQVAGVLAYEPVTPTMPLADIGNIMAGMSPFGSSAAINDSLSILNQNFGGSSYNYYIRGAAQ